MQPRKFIYREYGFFGTHYLIEWRETGLHAQQQHRFLGPDYCDEAILNIDGAAWSEFKKQVTALELDPVAPDGEPVCDGLQVECHITFNRRLIKFHQSEPEFNGLDSLQGLINDLTICELFPKGVLLD